MNRKREKPYSYPHRHEPHSQPKRRRPPPPPFDDESFENGINMRPERSAPRTPSTVMVIGISQDCSMLDVKSRFEIYGSISRTTIHPDGVAYVTFRSKDAAESAISASLDPSFGITLDSNKVQVIWAGDSAPQWRAGVMRKDCLNSSKLLRDEIPLSRHGKGNNRLGSMIVNPNHPGGQSSYSGGMKMGLKGREMVAYDDIV
ncbi:uncharacterized protein At1g27050 [Impatiens glandulifera]|uniref:uncharacterized protein At1g27050 n=1 Tax=Impatiens glandulifera TaxID=253017 RepID=UPI001FB0519E|nr:uncharacterized protein At1g27050 [Impatiens glandulifera]